MVPLKNAISRFCLFPQLSSAYFHNCLEYSVTTESKGCHGSLTGYD